MTRKGVKLPSLLEPSGAVPHTGAVVPQPSAPQAAAPPPPGDTQPARPRRVSTSAGKPPQPKTVARVPPVEPAAIPAVLGGPVTRVDVQVPVGISNWLRSATRPEHTALTRSLGARTPASSLLTAAVELLAGHGMDLSTLDSSEPEAVTAALGAALREAASK